MSNRPNLPSTRDMPSRFGRVMLLGAWVAAIALLATLFNGYLENQRNPNRNLVLETLPGGTPQVVLTRNNIGHYVATGSINGKPVEFLLDTGATTVSLPLELANQLGLRLREGGLSKTANGMVQTWFARLDSVSLGGLAVTNIRAVVMPNMPGEEVLLGMDFLKRFELLQRGDTLTVRIPQ